jgi:hypothetical protein
MVNNRVKDQHALLKTSREEAGRVTDKVEESDYRKIGWVVDPMAASWSCGSRQQRRPNCR